MKVRLFDKRRPNTGYGQHVGIHYFHWHLINLDISESL